MTLCSNTESEGHSRGSPCPWFNTSCKRQGARVSDAAGMRRGGPRAGSGPGQSGTRGLEAELESAAGALRALGQMLSVPSHSSPVAAGSCPEGHQCATEQGLPLGQVPRGRGSPHYPACSAICLTSGGTTANTVGGVHRRFYVKTLSKYSVIQTD